ncbi:phosphodiester glycosidase family protein [Pelomonas sp. SE-A7]|uniref:phosphodiester glycosidase family protein n=1 Tax=Pelomonas sp. SE-A7 TaxID=3054953 RepID=UPI00259D22D2|nr:phosphodiester glycosidase family protein [Pelomonas sp. SE-A7]MDM4765919.1 phosphodiester glycosidase family protein [Pelomonas sp. SE-A7]
MSRRLAGLLLVLWLAGCASIPAPYQGHAKGLDYARITPFPESVVHALRVDLQTLQVSVSPPAEKGLPLDQMASSAGALASINVSYFNKEFQVRGLTVSNGEAWAPVFEVARSPLLACDAAQRCEVVLQPPAQMKPEWSNVVAGTPWLLDHGRRRTAEDDERCGSHCKSTHPRTAVGLDASGRYLIIALAEGRRPPVLGLSLVQMSAVMAQLGAVDAINLDGGGSSTLLMDGRSVMQRPFNEPALRKVANALHIRARP